MPTSTVSLLGRLAPAYSSISIFVFGHGLISTWLVVSVAERQLDAVWLGLLTAAYFIGLVSGSFVNSHLLCRFGHIRAYAVYASLLTVIALSYSLIQQPAFWTLLRLLGGFATGGLLLVVESWMLLNSTPANRGRVMAVYMGLFYAFLAAGQYALALVARDGFVWVSIAAAFAVSLSTLPVALTRSPAPEPHGAHPLSLRQLAQLSPAGAWGSFTSGVLLGVLYGFFPACLIEAGLPRDMVALFVAVVTLGGMSLQYPLGRWSDGTDRRRLLAGLALVLAGLTAMLDTLLGQAPPWVLLPLLFLFGGLLYCLYPISVSHACDELPRERIVAANQGLLVAYALGSIVGPLGLAALVRLHGAEHFFQAQGAVVTALLLFLLWRLRQRPARTAARSRPFAAAPPNTPLSAEIDPRAHPSDETGRNPIDHRGEN